MKKIILFPIMLILLSLGVLAQSYDVNTTIRINSEYKVLGVYTNVSNSNLTIYYPNGLTVVENVGMTNEAIGKWYYDYNIGTIEGEYTAVAKFYNNSVLKGNDTGTFDVGDVNVLKWNVCPTGTQGWVGMWIFIILIVILGLAGIIIKFPALVGVAGGFSLLISFMTWYCGNILGWGTATLGFFFMITAFSIKS